MKGFHSVQTKDTSPRLHAVSFESLKLTSKSSFPLSRASRWSMSSIVECYIAGVHFANGESQKLVSVSCAFIPNDCSILEWSVENPIANRKPLHPAIVSFIIDFNMMNNTQ